jgi:hypothetical protein
MTIEIKNRLMMIGNKVLVPGQEPLSEQTTNSLSVSMQGSSCFLDVNKALEIIPGSRIVISSLDSGTFGHNKQFELPSGPPPNGNECPRNCFPDWYAVLREVAVTYADQTNGQASCETYEGIGQRCEYNDFYDSLDPAKRS